MKTKKVIRKLMRPVMYPIVFIVGWLYKWYMSIVKNKTIKLKYKDIVDGFSYMIITDPQVEQIAKHRAAICSKCPYAAYVGKSNTVVVDKKQYDYKLMVCKGCGCNLAAKVRAMSDSCPLDRW